MDFLLTSQVSDSFSIGNTLYIIFSALLLGLFISATYMFTHKKDGYESGFAVTLIMISAIIAMIILLVGNNVARAFSLAGAFSLIRFRSEPGDPKDIAYVFFTVGVGLACGMGFILYALIFCVIMCGSMLLMYGLKFPRENNKMLIKITIPENVDYFGLFDEVFEKYTKHFNFKSVKTVDFGSMFEVAYEIDMNKGINHKEFLDELRCRNNNLNIALSAHCAKK